MLFSCIFEFESERNELLITNSQLNKFKARFLPSFSALESLQFPILWPFVTKFDGMFISLFVTTSLFNSLTANLLSIQPNLFIFLNRRRSSFTANFLAKHHCLLTLFDFFLSYIFRGYLYIFAVFHLET